MSMPGTIAGCTRVQEGRRFMALPSRCCPLVTAQIRPLAPKQQLRPAPTAKSTSNNTRSSERHSRTSLRQCSAIYYGGSSPSADRSPDNFIIGPGGYDRVAAASPAARQALLSNAIASCTNWRQLEAVVDRYGRHLTANNVSHIVTRLEQLLTGRQLTTSEAVQIENLLQWLLARGRDLNAYSQLGPQALGATAGALTRMQEEQRRRQQQQQEDERQRADSAARRQVLQQLADAAVAQRGRLTPQALQSILSALASLDESGMSAEELQQLLNSNNAVASKRRGNSSSRDTASSPAPARKALPQQHQQQLQQRHDLPAAARQLGQLSPELAQEWYDRALRQSLQQGVLPPGINQRYLSGFLAREINRTADTALKAQDTTTSSSSSGSSVDVASGAAALESVVRRYSRLVVAAHICLALHRLAELVKEEKAGKQQEVESAAASMFQQFQQHIQSADAAAITSIINSCKDLGLYSKTLVSALLGRAKTLMQQQLQGLVGIGDEGAGFSGRQLGVLLHSLAVLGLRPSDAWLRLAVVASGACLNECHLTDLERLLSSLLLMRIQPMADWTAAAEQRLEHLAAAIGNTAATTTSAAAADQDADDLDADEDAGDTHKTLVACVKALALLGGQRARYWYRSILADEERTRLLLQQQQQQHGSQQEAQRERQREVLREQQQQQRSVPSNEPHIAKQLRRAVAQNQQQQQQRQRQRHAHRHQQASHKHNHTSGSSSSSSSGGKKGDVNRHQSPALTSLDEIMSQQLLEQEGNAAAAAVSNATAGLPNLTTPIHDDEEYTAAAKPSAAASSSSSSSSSVVHDVSPASPAAWAAEQSGRWAKTEGEQLSPAAELEQQLDDSQTLFGSSSSSGSSRKGAKGSSKGSSSSKSTASRSKEARQQSQQQSPGREIPILFDNEESSSSSSSSKQQRSDAEAAAALSALMSEVDQQQVDESARSDVLHELGLGPQGQLVTPAAGTRGDNVTATDQDNDDTAAAGGGGGSMTLEEIQAAADAAAEAVQELDKLQQQQQQQQRDTHSRRRLHKEHKDRHKHTHEHAAVAESPRTKQQQQQQVRKQLRPLGFSGEAAFTAAAKNLSSSKPSRAYLLGCLEAVEMQQSELRQKLAEKQALAAVADAARQQQQQQQQRNPLVRQLQQLQQDFDRARKRFNDEKSGIKDAAVAEVVEKLLPLLDSFDAALAAQQKQQQQQGGVDRDEEQIHLVYQSLNAQLLNILQSQGVIVLGGDDSGTAAAVSVGSSFNPDLMEAVMRQPAPSGFGDGDVLQVLRKGYKVGDRLIRPALVVVAYED